jgi:hypothetical protein
MTERRTMTAGKALLDRHGREAVAAIEAAK